jgi:hypothetical protein
MERERSAQGSVGMGRREPPRRRGTFVTHTVAIVLAIPVLKVVNLVAGAVRGGIDWVAFILAVPVFFAAYFAVERVAIIVRDGVGARIRQRREDRAAELLAGEGGRLAVAVARRRCIVPAMIVIVFVTAGARMVATGEASFFGYLAIIVFGGFALILGKLVLDTRPVVVAEPHVLRVRGWPAINWQELRGWAASGYSYGNVLMLSVEPSYWLRTSRSRGLWTRIYPKLTLGRHTIYIPCGYLPVDARQLAQLLHHFRHEYVAADNTDAEGSRRH